MEAQPFSRRPPGRTVEVNGLSDLREAARSRPGMAREHIGPDAARTPDGARTPDAARLLAEDRERIGHDLHDLVIRSLFDVSLKLHGALPLIADDRAERRVGDALGDIDQIITNVRLAVFAPLHERCSEPEAGLRRRVVDLVDEIGHRLDQHPTLALDGPLDAMTDTRSAEGLIAVLRELLLGLARHAGARASRIGLAARTDPQPHLCVQVRGVRSDRPDPDRSSDLTEWLDTIRDQITAVDGELVTDVTPHAITLSWTVPAHPEPPTPRRS